jgi:hypothetical protein
MTRRYASYHETGAPPAPPPADPLRAALDDGRAVLTAEPDDTWALDWIEDRAAPTRRPDQLDLADPIDAAYRHASGAQEQAGADTVVVRLARDTGRVAAITTGSTGHDVAAWQVSIRSHDRQMLQRWAAARLGVRGWRKTDPGTEIST